MKKSEYYPFLPINEYIPDGEPHVFGDRIYLYGSHDIPGGNSYCQGDYQFYSAAINELTKWNSKGTSYRADQDPDYSREKPYMFAPDCVKGNDGRFYLYYAMAGVNGKYGYEGPIKVAVFTMPDGPFEFYGTVQNPDGTPFIRCVPFDPAVINDNGIVRLYYGAGYLLPNFKVPFLNSLSHKINARIFGKKPEEVKKESLGISGAVTVELADDMITVISKPCKVTPNEIRNTEWEKHPFFEASSIRKIDGVYYFIYSSTMGHELCYATSEYPDRDFKYRGVIISNGDIGYQGRKPKDRIAFTGNNHGSIECIKHQWYIFYHRQTNGTNFSRQAHVEQIQIMPDGSIPQVCMTSMGFCGDAYFPEGHFPAVIACILNNGKLKMAGYSQLKKVFPRITQTEDEVYISGINNHTRIGFRYFAFNGSKVQIQVRIRGAGTGKLYVFDDEELQSKVGELEIIPSDKWSYQKVVVEPCKGKKTLMFLYKGNRSIEWKDLIIESYEK